MSKQTGLKPIAAAIGTTFVVSLAASPIANAVENPFAVNELSGGYMVAEHEAEGKCGEGKCGGEKKEAEGKCGEGKCGGEKKEGKKEAGKEAEGKCGEGKCGS